MKKLIHCPVWFDDNASACGKDIDDSCLAYDLKKVTCTACHDAIKRNRERNREHVDRLHNERLEKERLSHRQSYQRKKAAGLKRAYDKEHVNALKRQWRKERKERKECITSGCYTYTFDGHSYCKDCRIKKRAYNAKYAAIRKALHQCRRCNNTVKPDSSSSLCESCEAKRVAYRKTQHKKRLNAGYCTKCKNKAYGYRCCTTCREKENLRKLKSNLTPGQCYRCKAPSGHYRDCTACREKEAARKRLKRKATSAGICTRCGAPSGDYRTCPDCREHKREWNRSNNEKRKAEREANKPRCYHCSELLPRNTSHKACAPCRKEHAAQMRVKRRQRKRFHIK